MGSTSIPEKYAATWWHSPLSLLYENLTRNDSPKPVDIIFVFAGRMDRKRYGIDLYRPGVAPRLVLSVGRFEVSKMPAIEFEATEELLALRNRTAPDERHFFCEKNASGIRIRKLKLRRCSTYGEVLAIREYLEGDMVRRMIVVSTDIHLRRVAVTFGRAFRDTSLEVCYCPVPTSYTSLTKHDWWVRSEDRKYVLKETIKLAACSTILRMPEWMVRRIMRLKG